MIKIIIKNFTYISYKYYKDMEYLLLKIQDNTYYSLNFNDFKCKKFQNELYKIHINIYKYNFYESAYKIFTDDLFKQLILLEDITILLEYIKYKYNFWNFCIKKVMYSYIVFFLVLLFIIIININDIFMFNNIIYLYIISFIILQIIFYHIILVLIINAYKKYSIFTLYTKLVNNNIDFNKFIILCKKFNYYNYNLNNIHNYTYKHYFKIYEKYKFYLEYIPLIINFINIILCIVFLLNVIYNIYLSIISLIKY